MKLNNPGLYTVPDISNQLIYKKCRYSQGKQSTPNDTEFCETLNFM
jgi:hypothetical protein